MKGELTRHALIIAWITWVFLFSLINTMCMVVFNETYPLIIAIPITLISLMVFILELPVNID